MLGFATLALVTFMMGMMIIRAKIPPQRSPRPRRTPQPLYCLPRGSLEVAAQATLSPPAATRKPTALAYRHETSLAPSRSARVRQGYRSAG